MGHTTFGDSFGRELDGWIRRNFTHVQTLSGSGPGPLVLDVWIRR